MKKLRRKTKRSEGNSTKRYSRKNELSGNSAASGAVDFPRAPSFPEPSKQRRYWTEGRQAPGNNFENKLK